MPRVSVFSFLRPLWLLGAVAVCAMAWSQNEAGSVAMQNVGLLLEGAVVLDNGAVELTDSPRAIRKKLERVVGDVWAIAGLEMPQGFQGFSSEVEDLLVDLDELDGRDANRLGGRLENLSADDRLYWLVQSRLEEVKLQVAVEMGVYANRRLRLAIESGSSSEEMTEEEMIATIAAWSQIDPEAPLPALPFNPTSSRGEVVDRSALPGRGVGSDVGIGEGSDVEPDLLARIVDLLEAHDERLMALESGTSRRVISENGGRERFEDFRGPAALKPPSQVPALAAIGLPDAFDIRFGPGTAALGLNAQMQLSEVVELLGRYPGLRVVCTGHADAEGDRGANIILSKNRAQAVRNHLLRSGVNEERVLMNYFGEDRATGGAAADRRVEIAFFAN